MGFPFQNTPKSSSAGALPQTPLGSLQRFPRPPNCMVSLRGSRGMKGRGGTDYRVRGKRGKMRKKGGKENGEGCTCEVKHLQKCC